MTVEFSRPIFEESSNIELHGTRPVGAELSHTDRKIDMTKLIVAIFMYDPCVLYLLLFRPTIAQHILTMDFYIVSTVSMHLHNLLGVLFNICCSHKISNVFIIPAHRKLQHRDYTLKKFPDFIGCICSHKLTTSIYCNCNNWYNSRRFTDYILTIVCNDHLYKHFNLLILLIL